LLLANSLGWEVLCADAFTARWDGGDRPESVTTDKPIAQGHFGAGILTFTLPWLFRTPLGWWLHVRGPANWPKDGIAPLEGLIETDRTAATFTMN
jgi:hypothetical protein